MIGGFWTVKKLYHPQLWVILKAEIWVLFAVFFLQALALK